MFSQCTIPEGNYNTSTLADALCTAMNNNYPFTSAPGTAPSRFVPSAYVSNNAITISNPSDTFDICTDEQVVA